MDVHRDANRRRAFGLGSADSAEDRDRFEALAHRADTHGVGWRDLIGEGYRVSGDRYVGGVQIRYDWQWRCEELERRLGDLAHDS